MTKHITIQTTVHRQLAESLPKLGVTHLFGLVGDANLFMVDAYIEAKLGRYVACTHEANAVLAALGFAQVTGRTGVATITHGPALTNVVTALTEGVKGGIPLVLLCGDTAPGDLQHLQKIDQREVVAATGAGYVELRSPQTLTVDLERAFRLALHKRRPVVFNMRVDLQWSEAPEAVFAPSIPPVRLAAADATLLEEAAGMLASARRPLILAGRAAVEAGARDAIVRLARRLEAPLATTLKAQGLFRGEPFDLGICGGLSHPTAIETIAQSDCILALGASLSKHTTEEGAYTRGKRVIQILPDAEETPRLSPPSLLLIGDLAASADALVELFDLAEIPGSQATTDDLKARLAAEAEDFARLPDMGRTAAGTLDMIPALRRLNQTLPADRVLVADLGRFVTTAWRNLPVSAPRDLVYTCHFGGIGCGFGEAIGAATAISDRPTVLVAGDGGFLLSGLSELSTAVREKLDLIILLCNDGSYGAEHVQFTNRGLDPALSMTDPPNFAAIAAAMGMTAVTIRDEDSLSQACRVVKERNGPLLLDLRLDPTKIDM